MNCFGIECNGDDVFRTGNITIRALPAVATRPVVWQSTSMESSFLTRRNNEIERV